jgi:hypothetical protein
MAITSSTGEVIWIPYDYYLRPEAEGISIDQNLDLNNSYPAWFFITPGGKMEREPIINTYEILPINTVSIRLLLKDELGIFPARIDPDQFDIQIEPAIDKKIILQSNGSTINIIPDSIFTPEINYSITVSVIFADRQGHQKSFNKSLVFRVLNRNDISSNSFPSNIKEFKLKISQMAFPQPPILPSLNQIGFASLSILLKVIEIDPQNQKFIAWGVLKFGGEAAPLSRVSYFAFNGIYNNNWISLTAYNCLFEITAFDLPLDCFHLRFEIPLQDEISKNASILIQKQVGKHLLPLFRQMGFANPINFTMIRQYFKSAGWFQFFKAAKSFIPALLNQANPQIWKNWGLLNSKSDLIGVGTYQTNVLPTQIEDTDFKIEMIKFEYSSKKHSFITEFKPNFIESKFQAINILVMNVQTFSPLALNYNICSQIQNISENILVTLKIPEKFRLKTPVKAYLMIDLINMASINVERLD